jgi:hypothetical protein
VPMSCELLLGCSMVSFPFSIFYFPKLEQRFFVGALGFRSQ